MQGVYKNTFFTIVPLRYNYQYAALSSICFLQFWLILVLK